MFANRKRALGFGFLAVTAAAAATMCGCSSASKTPDTSETGDSPGTTGDDAGSTGAQDASSAGSDATAGDDAGQGMDGGGPPGTTDASDEGGNDSSTLSDAGSNADTGAAPNADESAWLDPMNQARAAVDAGEAPLTWNPIAAQVALNYAKMCNYEHNPNRSSDYVALGGTGQLGENIAAGAPMLTIAGANSGWINEEADYDYATNTCNTHNNTTECGHYTQIVWKTTTSVGCALVTCTTNSPFPTKYGTTWGYAVCDYAPPGNLVPQGQSMPERPY